MKVIAIVGPTASGKTSLSVRLAKRLNGEIISCDSMQIYKGMDIGTAKVTENEQCGIKHHLINIVNPQDPFSCSDYKDYADRAIKDIAGRGKTPIFCGGTGLYIDSVFRVSDFSPSVPDGIREELSLLDSNVLWNRLNEVDPESALSIHPNNVKRVIRALEIYLGTGKTKTEWDKESRINESEYSPLIIRLEAKNREILYDRINKRVDEMIVSGLVDECQKLNLDRDSNASQAIGYKEIYQFIDGKISIDEAIELLKKNSRNYAKRQLTWFRRYEDAISIDIEQTSDPEMFENIVNIAQKHLS